MGRQAVKNDELISALNARYALACANKANNQFNLKKALDSLRKHRGKILTAVDLGRVKDLNSRMAKLLEKVLNGTEPIIPPGAEAVLNRGPPIPQGFPYVPQVGSGARAILISMYRESRKPTYNGFMTKDEICARATDTGLSDTSFYPRRMEFHTAWDGVKTLEQHELVKRHKIGMGIPQRFLITDEGKALAHYLEFTLGNNNNNGEDTRVDDDSYFDEDETIPSYEPGVSGLGRHRGGAAERMPLSFEPIRGAGILGTRGRRLGEGSAQGVEFPESVLETGRDLYRAGKLVNVVRDEGGSEGGVQVFRAKCRSATLQRKMYDVSIVARTEVSQSAMD